MLYKIMYVSVDLEEACVLMDETPWNCSLRSRIVIIVRKNRQILTLELMTVGRFTLPIFL